VMVSPAVTPELVTAAEARAVLRIRSQDTLAAMVRDTPDDVRDRYLVDNGATGRGVRYRFVRERLVEWAQEVARWRREEREGSRSASGAPGTKSAGARGRPTGGDTARG